jgi:ABC-type amino acid transport substrate-binding protein
MRSSEGASSESKHSSSRRERLFWLLLAVCCWLLALRLIIKTWFPANTDPTWEQIQDSGVVRVGMDAAYPPFEVQDETGRFSGYDVDLAEELATRWGVRAEFINIHFDGLYDALLAGKCDLLISALPYDETLTQNVLYSQSYFNAGLLLVVREDERRIRSTGDLAGKKVGVELGASAHLEARRLHEQGRIPLQILPFPISHQVLEALLAGEADAAIVDSVSVYRFARDPGGVRYLKSFLTDEQYVIAMRPNSGYLRKRIADQLAQMKAEGSLQTLQDKWF